MRCHNCGEQVRVDEQGNLFEHNGDSAWDYVCAGDTHGLSHVLDEPPC